MWPPAAMPWHSQSLADTDLVQSEFSLGTFMTVLSIFGGRAYQVYYSATIARQQVQISSPHTPCNTAGVEAALRQ